MKGLSRFSKEAIFALVAAPAKMHKRGVEPIEIFSRSARRHHRRRANASPHDDRWLIARMATEISDRLNVVRKDFADILILGSDFGALDIPARFPNAHVTVADPGDVAALQCDEDRLPFADNSFDLIVAIGTLDTVNDLPGALILIRRMLRDNGLFLGAMLGAGSLSTLKQCILNIGIARFHPQIDVRSAGDLLMRAGFALPVADSEAITANYPNIFRLVGDLRANGLTNALAQRHPMRRADIADAAQQFSSRGSDKTAEQFVILTLTGWAPSRRVAFSEDR
jgi:Methyltransferase domain